MLEKRFEAVSSQVFTADGGANGSVTIADTSLFKVKQQVVIVASGQTNLALEVKRVISPTVMIVGPISGSINTFTNLSAYTTAASAAIFANEQKRPTITGDDFERAVYEEEPTVAKRVILVDQFGAKYDDDNPLPTSATFSGSISVGEVDQGIPNTVANSWPVKITDGTDTLAINPDGSLNVSISGATSTPGLSITHNEITSVASGVETTVMTVISPLNGMRVSKIEVSGDTVAHFRVKVDGTTIFNKRSWWTSFNQTFDFQDFINGLQLGAGQIITVTVLHARPFLGSFEATLMSV
jgi:hypothetical protein